MGSAELEGWSLEPSDEFDAFMDSLIEQNPDIPLHTDDMELFSSLPCNPPSMLSSSSVHVPSLPAGLSLPQDWAASGQSDGSGSTADLRSFPNHEQPYATSAAPSRTPSSSELHFLDLRAEHSNSFQQSAEQVARSSSGAAAGPSRPNCSSFAAAGLPPDPSSSRRAPRGSKKAPSAASLAQKKYMERQKLKMGQTEKRVVELTRALEDLMREKKELELKERITRHALDGITVHMDHLFADKVVREFQQLSLLKKKAELQSLVESREITIEEACGWPLRDFIGLHHQRFLERLEALLPAAQLDAASPAAKEISQLVTLHGDYDKTGAVASCFHWAMLCWNREEAGQRLPSEARPDWLQIMAELKLTASQQSALRAARRTLLQKMDEICQKRYRIFSQLGLEGLAGPKEHMHRCPAAMELYNNLRQEQTAVLAFILNADAALTCLQEAILEVRSSPWCPDVLSLTAALEPQASSQPQPHFSGLRPVGDAPVMPFATPYEVLTMPITGLGCGKNLRCGVVMCPSWTVLSHLCCPKAPQAQLASMSLLAVCCGRWRRLTSWEWLVQVRKTGELFQNPLLEGAQAPLDTPTALLS